MMRFFTSDLRRNIIKVVCLTLGLAIGFLLVAKVYFETTYDSFLPDSENCYVVTEHVVKDGEYQDYWNTPGGIAPAIKRYCPQVLVATRITGLAGGGAVRLEDGRVFETEGIQFADSCFFDFFSTEVSAGNPSESLSVIDHVAIPQSMADKIGGDVIGMRISAPDLSPNYWMTIGAVYRDYPLNSSFGNNILLSMSTLPKFAFDGRNNFMGNDRYSSYVRLMPGTSPEDLAPMIKQMLYDNLNKEDIDAFGFGMSLKPVRKYHFKDEGTKTVIWTLSMLAVLMLMSAGLNYLLIVIGQMGGRAREMAVRKCFGTGNLKIFTRVMGESLFFLVLSMVLAVLTVFSFSNESLELLISYSQSCFVYFNIIFSASPYCE